MIYMCNVPYISEESIEQQATELLWEYAQRINRKVVPPIPVENIAEKHLKITLEVGSLEEELGEKELLAAFWMDERRVMIEEEVLEHDGRFCFTVAHELGHFVLHWTHMKLQNQLDLFDKTPKPAIVCRKKDAKLRGEWQADRFAAALLMPEKFVRKARCSVVERLGNRWEQQESWRQAKLVIEHGNFTNVSNEAMKIRLESAGLLQSKDSSSTLSFF